MPNPAGIVMKRRYFQTEPAFPSVDALWNAHINYDRIRVLLANGCDSLGHLPYARQGRFRIRAGNQSIACEVHDGYITRILRNSIEPIS